MFKGKKAGGEGTHTLTDFRDGCDLAFSGLYERFQKPIVYYVKTMIRDAEVAEELVQEIFLKVFRFRGQYNEAYAFSTWLWTIARNTVRDYQRGVKMYVENDGAPSEFPVSPDDLASDDHNAEMLVVNKDQRRFLRKALKPLTKQQRRVLWLRVVRQLSYNEIARTLGLSLPSVKNLAHRAKAALACQAIVI